MLGNNNATPINNNSTSQSNLLSTTTTVQSNLVTLASSQNVVSYNRPKLDPYATWSANAITFADNNTVGTNPLGIFININNTIYSMSQTNGYIQIWSNNSISPTKTIFNASVYPCSFFVTSNGDIYIDNGLLNGQVTQWKLNANTGIPVMSIDTYCFGLFVDINELTTTMIQNPSTAQISTAPSPISLVQQVCFAPTITLVPGLSTLSSPIQYRRSQDFFIVSIITLNCNNSLSFKIQWTVMNCTSFCSNSIQLDSTIATTLSELYIPARTLSYGLYKLTLTVTMVNMSSLSSSSSVYVQISATGIVANLVQYGTSMITRGNQQKLQLDPGSYSVDLDGDSFNASNWKYKYYCRIYGFFTFPNLQGSLLTIDDMRNDTSNPSCLSNRTGWQLDNSTNSSLTILPGSLQSNRTYQFMVHMENRQNSSTQAAGYVLVKVEDSSPQLILISCVIWTLCEPNLEYQRVNPTTQVALFSVCAGNCTGIQNITWNIYYGTLNTSTNFTQWTLFNQMSAYRDIWFFGANTSNFTASNQLFTSNSQIKLWRFEVVYTFTSERSLSSLNFIINQPPENGSCSINPSNGTTSSLFNISCLNWFDEDSIKDYAVYAWTTDPTYKIIVAYSTLSIFSVQLPVGDNQTSLLHLSVNIRDQLDCITELNISAVTVISDTVAMTNLISDIQSSSSGNTTNPIIQLLASENQNIVGQVLTSVSQQFNQMNNDIVDKAISNGIPVTSISISSLSTQSGQQPSISVNQSVLNEYNKQLNSHATVRDYLISFTTQLPITTANSIKLQASSLVQLTKSTNELTRAALTVASDRCYRLTMALYSMRTRIPFEDVQTAASDLLQCAANVLSAVNGPLQQRTTILDLDSSRATTFPQDYDTDLESEWANPNLFSDGNDFSWETIQKNRNSYYQNELANQIMIQMKELITLITSSLNIHLNIGQDFIVDTSQVLMSLETKSFESFSNQFNKQIGNGQIQLPLNFNSFLNTNEKVSIRSIMEPLAAFGNSKSQSNTNLSRSISFSFLDSNQNELSIQTDLNHSITIIVPRDPNLIIPPMILQNVTSLNSTPHNLIFHYHYLNLTTTLPVSVHWEIQPLNTTVAYLFIYRFDQIPQLNSSINQVDGWTLLCPSNLINNTTYRYFIDNQLTVNHQAIIFGLRELNSTEINQGCFNPSINYLPITNEHYHFSTNYQLRIYTSGCYYLDTNNQWKADGVVVGSLTNHYETQCFSTHLTSFSGGFTVLPESVNWSYVFANADFMKNKTIYITVICVSAIYIILLVYSRYKDKKDIEKLGVTPLSDNHPTDQYFYQIIVFTGQRKDAGTKSNVCFVLHGDNDDTQIRRLADPQRPVLQRGGINAFIMSVPKSLGLLSCIRLWHDNSGKGSSSSWFLKYIIIRDLQTMEKFHFICQRWFAVEEDDGKIERVLPVASEIEKRRFSYLLTKRTYHSISDGHLWFSIFSRPPSNTFTRVQRCTCCFVLLFTSMFLNIMYYDLSNETNMNLGTDSARLSFGSFYISPQQIIIGIIVEFFALIPSLLLVQLFRRLRSRQQGESSLQQTLYRIKPDLKIRNDVSRKKSLTFPWWCIFIAYGLCIALVGVSILFIIARGIEFGDVKTQKWLASILSGFFSSMLLTQPLKIISLAILFACFCGKSNDDKEANEFLDDNQIDLDYDEEYLHSMEDNVLYTNRSSSRVNRLDDGEVDWARNQRLKEIHMWAIIREVAIYIWFLSLLYIVIYANRNSNSYLPVKHLRSYFFNSRQNNMDYTKISTINQYWNWLENSFVENIRAQQWYNGDLPRNLSGFINDKTNRLMGWPTIRQIRIKSTPCHLQNSIASTCLYDYSLFDEDNESYQPGWINHTLGTFSSSINQAFVYKSRKELNTYMYIGDHETYGGGGYTYELRGRLSDLRSNLSELHRLGWIDNRTRAVIIQMTLYNPNVDVFIFTTFLLEFLSTGGIHPTARFEPLNFYAFTSIFQLICTILYLIMIIYLMYIEIRSMIELKMNYFRRFWSYIELGIIICSWISVGIYIWRHFQFQHIGDLFKETNGYVYVNLQSAAYVNDILTYLLSFCCFFGTIKCIRLCRFNQRLCLFIHTLQYASKELFSFAIMFSVVFISFISLFYLIFTSTIWSCSTLLTTTQMLFEMTLMKFDAHELVDAAAFLGPMFLSIINRNFQRARENLVNDDQMIFSYMMKRFQRATGLLKLNEEEVQAERDALMRLDYHDPIERFPDKIDQLLETLNRLYMNQKMDAKKKI
ncbi:hypothetical protein I4U23_007054 [Adineta vaga]|nr:hypothetical protein I4U23_007054 [Adineta vaga]